MEEVSSLPPGVTQTGATVNTAQPITPVQTVASTAVPLPANPITPLPDSKMDIQKIAIGVAFFTLVLYGIYYFRYKTTQYNDKTKEQDQKISTLQQNVSAIMTPQQ